MSGFSGADVAQLRALSSRINTQSEKLREIAASSTVALMAAEWSGNDIDAVRSNWRRGSLPTINALAGALHEMSAELDKHAAEQERVSGGSSGAGSWMDWFRNWWEGWLQRLVPPVMPIPGLELPGTQRPGDESTPGGDTPRQEPPAAPQPPPPNNAERFNEWRSQHPDGSRLDYNGNGYLQCVELINGYVESLYPGHSKSELVGDVPSAKDMFASANDQYFEKVPGPPQPGDIMVIGQNTYSPTHGHVSIVESTDPLRVVQQSGARQHQSLGTFAGGVSAAEMNALVGYLRPRK